MMHCSSQSKCIVIGTLAVTCLSACGGNYVSEQARQQFGFDTGSYWIYRNADSVTLDSFHAYERIETSAPQGGFPNDRVDFIEFLRLKQYTIPNNTDKGAGLSPLYRIDYQSVDLVRFPFQPSQDTLTLTHRHVLVTPLPSAEIESTTYTDVWRIAVEGRDTFLLKPKVGYLRLPFVSAYLSRADYYLVRFNVKL